MRQICGKKAVVTGAASGIGRAIALRLAAEGANLYLIDIDEPGLANTAEKARLAGVEVVAERCDVSQPGEISATVALLKECWGELDILVNNAGITYYGRTDRMSTDHWQRVTRINLLSHIQFTSELLPLLLSRREAHIINVCSVLGLLGMPKVAAYCTSKFAMVGFSESLRHEYGRVGLGVTALCPGFVRTNLFTNAPLELGVERQKLPPTFICTTPERVAAAAIKAIRRNRRLVVIEPLARTLYLLKRFAPGAIDAVFHFGRRKRTERKLGQLARGTLTFGVRTVEELEADRRAA